MRQLVRAATLRWPFLISWQLTKAFLFVTKKEAKKSRCCEAANPALGGPPPKNPKEVVSRPKS